MCPAIDCMTTHGGEDFKSTPQVLWNFGVAGTKLSNSNEITITPDASSPAIESGIHGQPHKYKLRQSSASFVHSRISLLNISAQEDFNSEPLWSLHEPKSGLLYLSFHPQPAMVDCISGKNSIVLGHEPPMPCGTGENKGGARGRLSQAANLGVETIASCRLPNNYGTSIDNGIVYSCILYIQ